MSPGCNIKLARLLCLSDASLTDSNAGRPMHRIVHCCSEAVVGSPSTRKGISSNPLAAE